MIKIADILASLRHCVDAQRNLEQTRKRATGDVEYFSYSFVQDLKQAEADLEQILNAYIDQRVSQKLEQLKTPSAFELPSPAVASAVRVG
jgi:hypothetical protein